MVVLNRLPAGFSFPVCHRGGGQNLTPPAKISKTKGGGLNFSKMSEIKKSQNKNKLTFLVFPHANMPLFMSS